MQKPVGRAPLQKGGFKVIGRVIRMLFKNYKPMLFAVMISLVISAICGSIAGVFLQNIYVQIERMPYRRLFIECAL